MSNGPLSAMAKGLGKKAFPLLQDNMLHWGRDLTAQAVIDIEGIRRESQEVQSSQWSISELIETEDAMRTSKAGLTGEVWVKDRASHLRTTSCSHFCKGK